MTEINGQLLAAVEHGKLQSVKDLINQYGLDSSEGYVPLCKSIMLKHTEITKLLLTCGSRVNSRSKITPSSTPLHYAVQNGDVEIIELLLNHDADMRAQNEDGWTPLLSAVSMDNEGIVDLLLNEGSSIRNYDCISPIHVAVERSLYKMTEKLLKLGVYENITCTSKEEFTPLLRAAKIGDVSIVQLLLKHEAKVNSETTEGLTPLHFASENGNVEIIKLLLSGNADVNACAKNMFTPLYFAVKNHHKEAAKCLIDNGAYINPEFKNGEMVSIENLLNCGFSVEPDDINDNVLLHTAIAMGYIQIVEDLIKHGLDLNSNKRENFTILHIAAKYKQVEIAKLLLSHGADVDAIDEAGKRAIYYSTERSDVIMTKLLLSHGASVKKSPELLRVATSNVCKEIVEILLQNKVDIEASDEYGRTALHLTASNTQLKYQKKDMTMGEIAKLLLSMGANVNATTNKEKLTALHIACGNSYTNIVELLLEYKADVHCVVKHISPLLYCSEEGDTALHIAARNDHTDALKMLLQNGADVRSKNNDGATALYVASEGMFPDAVSILLDHGSPVDSQDVRGDTALFMAFYRRNNEIVELLLESGSDINILNRHNKSAFDIYDRSEFGSDAGYLEYIYDDIYGYVYQIIGLHIIMLKTANLYVREEFLIYMNTENDDMRLHMQKCEDEIKKLKLEKIANNKLSFYDILTKNTNSLITFARNRDIKRVIESDYTTKFPIYAPIIERNLAKVTQRRFLLERAHEFMECYSELPYVCSDHILNYLSDDDLEKFINVSKTPLTVKNL